MHAELPPVVPTSSPSSPAPIPDSFWEEALWDTIAHLQTLIRLETVNPPGNEMAVARYLDDVLRGAGVETQLSEPAPGRAGLVGRIRGDGSERPILLLAHMDVVGVEREKWTMQPFGGEILDGFLYGRGAIDDKGMLAANLQTMLLVRRRMEETGRQPTRDILFVATSDEEAGGLYGIDWVLEHHPELAEAEYALNEGGRVRIHRGTPLYIAIQCAEKVPHNVVVTARGPGGHAAVPHDGNAITHLALALTRIAAHVEPLELSPITSRFFGELSTVWPDEELRNAMADVSSNDPKRQRRGAYGLGQVPSFNALLRNGVSPTLIHGGVRTNVIPTEAGATLNIRTLPGSRIEQVVTRLRTAVDDPNVTLEVTSSGEETPTSPAPSPMFDAIAETARELQPTILPLPYLSTGATDSAPLRRAGIHCYGVLPFPLTQDDEDRMHGHDERVGIPAIKFGTRLVYGVVAKMVGMG
jgi:acetylornithine deacetylase/succinyl-diaminopimelate desuccinylase-like protein